MSTTSVYRTALPQLGQRLFMTDGGIETTLIFHDGLPLELFAAFTLLKDAAGTAALRRYFGRYTALALRRELGLVLETPTWRASPDWGAQLGYGRAALADVNRRAVDLLTELRAATATARCPMVLAGVVGPRGDGYKAGARMDADAALAFHAPQVEDFARSAADLVSAYTMTYTAEALGIVRAAQAAAMPVSVAYTVETDGRLPSGEALGEAIEKTDDATGGYPAYYMINCAHPTHFEHVLATGGRWRERIRGLRANASRRSHAELDESADLDSGNPEELGRDYRALEPSLPRLSVVGGCCGTDERHVEAIVQALTTPYRVFPAPRA